MRPILTGFTANEMKEGILDDIRSSRSGIRLFSELIAKGSPHSDEYHYFIAHEQKMIKRSMAELIELEKFRVKEGLEPDEPYQPFKDRSTFNPEEH